MPSVNSTAAPQELTGQSLHLDVANTREAAKPIHFPWLTEVRFFAAFAVLIHHTAQARWLAGLGSQPFGWIEHLGNHGVRVFFVLSGFLITHLLLTERAKTGTIAIKKFYLRRVLRIWPLYYALLAVAIAMPASSLVVKEPSMIATLAAAQFQSWEIKFGLLAFLLPNIALMVYPAMLGFAQAWSVGVEEQFYLLWPVLMKKLGNRPLLALSGVLSVKVIVVLVFNYIFFFSGWQMTPQLQQHLAVAFNCVNIFQIEAMVIGGTAAYLLLQHRELFVNLTRNNLFRLTVAACMIVCLSQAWSQLHEQIGCDIVYALLLLTLTLSGQRLPQILERPLTYFGKISYGIYMLHPLVICLVVKALSMTKIPVSNTFFGVLMCLSIIILTLLASSASYELFERRFLNIKRKYMVIESSAT
ncbi:MAG: acyltransferase [Candidatus Obscuribacterales bacterium]|nr:acyltransferase [Candidatus Obscuribacterales bacterium]